MHRVTALLAAAGKGTRLGASIPKAFVTLRDVTLVERSVRAMVTSNVVDSIIVLISPDMEAYAEELFTKRGLFGLGVPVLLVHGGAERADSVWAGLQAIDEEDGVVLIHDSARALTPPGLIARVAQAVLAGAPAVIPVLPVSDTIKRVAEGVVVDTPPRVQLRAAQTPQGFDLRSLRQANALLASGFAPTDDASLMERAGFEVRCVPGDPMAFKVTNRLDLLMAQHVVDDAEPTIFEVPSD